VGSYIDNLRPSSTVADRPVAVHRFCAKLMFAVGDAAVQIS
jgi:hypothetical protein